MKVARLLPVICLLNMAHAEPLAYPKTRQAEQIDEYHGVKIADPYRWLEDDNSEETKAWVEAQNGVTFRFLEAIPQRATIKERMTKLWNYERFGLPELRGGRTFYTRNSGLQNQRVLYVADAPDAVPRVLLDVNLLAADGTVGLSSFEPSEDGKLLAYSLSRAGSDWLEWRVRDVATGEDRPDFIEWAKFSGASWKKDGSGFFYSRYDAPEAGEARKGVNEFHKLYFHRLSTPQSEDALIYERRDHKDWGFYGAVSDDGRYLVIHISQGTETKNRLYYHDLAQPGAPVIELLNDFDASYEFIGNDGATFFLKTDLDAPRSRVIAIDLSQSARAHWRELIAQTADTLSGVSFVGGQFIAHYLKDAHSAVQRFAWDAVRGAQPLGEVALPGLGTASGFGGRATDRETYYVFSSFTVPGTIYRLNLATGKSTVFREPKVDFQPADYETKQVFARSKDGTRVPIFITHKRGLKLDGANPTILYGYGGFNISLTPSFGVSSLVWMEMGGVFAMANLRGGGEYGEEWHRAGMKLQKQNVFDDFIAAAEWLIAEKYTSPAKLAIEGGSNGGLLVAACMTQRPEMFGAVLPGVGVLDMLRFEKFTIGWAWRSDYGSVENADEFRALHAYSPLHALRPGVRYPATLITTADHDDRVVPAHSFKFAARLQECQALDGPPVLIRIDVRAGHGGNKPTTKVIEERTDELSFLVRVLGMESAKE